MNELYFCRVQDSSPRGNQRRLAYNERSRHAVAEALHQRIAQRGNSSNQIGERQHIEDAHQIPHPRLFDP